MALLFGTYSKSIKFLIYTFIDIFIRSKRLTSVVILLQNMIIPILLQNVLYLPDAYENNFTIVLFHNVLILIFIHYNIMLGIIGTAAQGAIVMCTDVDKTNRVVAKLK